MMARPRLHKLSEIRRAAPIAAAVLMLASLAFPMWRIVLTAPQYAGRNLVVRLYAYPRLEGDVREVVTLNHYVGFHFPDPVYLEPNFEVAENAFPVPEWSVAPLLFVAVAIGALAVALSSEATVGKWLKRYFVGVIGTFVVLLAWVQVRLYQVGHSLDENAPMTGIHGFTPPVLGRYQIANISGNAWIDTGGYILIVAVVLLGFGYHFRHSTATVGDLPELLGGSLDRVKARLTARTRR